MTRSKKIVAVVLAIVMVMSMAACAKKEEAAETAAETEAVTEAVTETEAPAEAPTEPQTEAETETQPALTSSVEASLLHPELIQHYQSAQREDNTFAYEMRWSEVRLPEEEAQKYPQLSDTLNEFSALQVDNSTYERMGLLENIKSIEEESREDIPELTTETTLSVIRADTNYVCIESNFYGYWGGAHGGTLITANTYKTADGSKVKLEDIITDEGKFIDTVKTKLLEEHEKEEFFDIDTDMAKYTIRETEDELDEERSFTWELGYDSVRIFFNQYDIAPYAAGIQIVEIKFADYPELFKGNVDVVPQDRIEYKGYEFNEHGYRYDTYAVSFGGNQYTYEIWKLDDDECRLDVKSGDEVIGNVAGDVYTENEPEDVVDGPKEYHVWQVKTVTYQPLDPAGFKLDNFDRVKGAHVVTEYAVSDNGMPVEK